MIVPAAMKQPRKQTNNESTILISVWVPKELARDVELIAKRSDLTKSQVIRKAIKHAVKQPA